jgi:predicted adenine nucleotide alpha hydrolase (AANH) superfamily ATPase
MDKTAMSSILLHTCCAPCASASSERLLLEGKEVILFFCNSNIYPEEEYKLRLENARILAKALNIVIEEDTYDHDAWLAQIKGFEHEPERGARCAKCFDFSLRRTSLMAKRLSIPEFTTTLTISPHKNSKKVFEVGSQYSGFSPIDFKKQNGFFRSLQLSEEMHLYRQSYCGCEFSMPLSTATV